MRSKKTLKIALVVLMLLSSIVASGEETERFRGKAQTLVQINQFAPANYKESKNPGNITRTFSFVFQNLSMKEVSAVDVRLVMREKQTKKLVYDCGTQTISSFSNWLMPYEGFLVPHSKTVLKQPLTFEMPSSAWRLDTYESFEITEARAIKNPKDLHEVGHLYTLFHNSTPAQILAVLKRDPSLCKVSSPLHLTTTHIAFAISTPEVINFVLQNGGSMKDTTDRGGKVIDYAPMNANVGSLEMAVKMYGVNYVNTLGQVPLTKALFANNSAAVKWLLAHGAKTEIEDKNGTTPAMVAIENGLADFLDLFVKAGANPHYLNRNGYGWFHMAVYNTNMLPVVLKYKVSIEQMDKKSKVTPFLLACVFGNYSAIEWLVAHGADWKVKDIKGHDGVYFARKTNTLNMDKFYNEAVARGLATRKKLKG